MTAWSFDWDDAFDNGGYIRDAKTYPDRWASDAENFRAAQSNGQIDVTYGPNARNKMDIFRPSGAVNGLFVFVHGGYWRLFDKSTWSHLAAGAVHRGWAVVIPSYPLCPTVDLPEIAPHVAEAINLAAQTISGPIRLAGHSAGGHLVTRMISSPELLYTTVQSRITGVTSISGLHDLRPLTLARMNSDLGLSDATAAADSPALLTPSSNCQVTAWVGAQERPEFLRQTRLLEENWSKAGHSVRAHYDPSHHHFSVIEGLQDPTSPLISAILD